MINKMTQYSFILLQGDKEKFLSDLQQLGVVDITRSFKPVDDASNQLLLKAESLKDAVAFLGSQDFHRVRIGTGPVPEERDLISYVLSEIPKDQRQTVYDSMQEGCEAVIKIIRENS